MNEFETEMKANSPKRGAPAKALELKKRTGAIHLTESEWRAWDALKLPGEGRGDVARRLLVAELKRQERRK